jgi:excisionase family DNA binding protein
MKEVLTTGEVARICNVTIRTVIKWFESGKLKGYKIPGSKDRRIPRVELIRFMRENGLPMEWIEDTRVRRLLVADDESRIRELLVEDLSRHPYLEVDQADNGIRAGMKLLEFRPHLLILDYNLGDIDGREVIRMIRSDPQLAECRILVISGYLTEEDGQKLIEEGADGFLRKPFRLEAIREWVDEQLRSL